MTISTAQEVYAALVAASLTPSLVDAVNLVIYYSASVDESSVHTIVDSLGWTDCTISVIGDLEDPYTQYLNILRHDTPLRHILGTSVPRDSSKIDLSYLDTDGTLTANSDSKIATQKATKTYTDTKVSHSLATAVSQFLVSSAAGEFVVKTVADIKTLLGLGGAAYCEVGSTSGTVAAGDDARLSDARTPTSHDNTQHSATYITSSGVTFEALNTNGDIGTGSDQVSVGNHTHPLITWGGVQESDPISPVDGYMYWNSTTPAMRFYVNSSVGWKTITTT